MRLLYASHAPLRSRRADAVNVMRMCEALAKEGHKVELAVPNYRRTDLRIEDLYAYYGVEPIFQIRFLPARMAVQGTNLYALAVLQRVHQTRPDLLYTRSAKVLALCSRLARVRLLVEIHHIPSGMDRAAWRILTRIAGQERLARVVVINRALAEAVSREYGFPAELVAVVPSAAPDPARVKPAAIAGDKGFPVGYAGAFRPGHGIDLIFELARRLPDMQFYLWGGTKEELATFAERKPENVKLYGWVPPAAIPSYLAAMEVLLAPYQRRVTTEGGTDIARWISPTKLFDYMAVGRAVVASDLPSVREVLCHGKTGLLCDPDSVDEWCLALQSLRAHAELRNRLGANARRRFLECYSTQIRAQRVIEGLTIDRDGRKR